MTEQDYQMLRDYCGVDRKVYVIGNEFSDYPMTKERQDIACHLVEKYGNEIVKMNVITSMKKGNFTLIFYYVPQESSGAINAIVANEDVMSKAIKDLGMNLESLLWKKQVIAKPYSTIYPYAQRAKMYNDKKNLSKTKSTKEVMGKKEKKRKFGMSAQSYNELLQYCGEGKKLYMVSREMKDHPMTPTREWLFNCINEGYRQYCMKAVVFTYNCGGQKEMAFQHIPEEGEKFRAYVLNEDAMSIVLEENGMELSSLVEREDYFTKTYKWIQEHFKVCKMIEEDLFA